MAKKAIHVSGFHFYKVDGRTVKVSENWTASSEKEVISHYNTIGSDRTFLFRDSLMRLIETGRVWTCVTDGDADDFYELTFDEAIVDDKENGNG